MLEIIGGSLLASLLLFLLLKKPVYKLWDDRACPSYRVDCDKELKVDTNKEQISILMLGDFGSGTDAQRSVAKAAEQTCEEKGCDLVLFAGDNFIQKGVSGIDDEQWETKFETVYQQQVPFYAVLGNHDLAGNWRAQIDYTKYSERWNLPAPNYELKTAPVHISAINTTCSVKTLWRLYKRNESPWRLVLGHHPVVSSGRHGGMTWLERLMVSLSGIDFFVSGHNHVLEHAVYRGIDQIVSGGGGSPLGKTPINPNNWTRFIEQTFGYIWAGFTDKEASFHYFDINGTEVYTFRRQKQ